jgi:hypothetical protein
VGTPLQITTYAGWPPHNVNGMQKEDAMPEPRPAVRPLCADARRSREMIIAAAEDLFLRDGASASLEEIAWRAGVGSATLHRHFATASTCRALRPGA